MELSAFAAPSFSSVQWLNALLEPLDPADPSAIETTANEVSFKLQLFIQQLSLSLQDTAFQIHQRAGLLTKLERDFEALKGEAIVKNGMLLKEVESNRSAQYLDVLDTVKMRMEEAQRALREADSWSLLVSDVESLFQTHNLELLVERVMQLERSLDTLRSAPDFTQKHQMLERIKNRLEASMAPRLVAAVSSILEDDAARWFTLFGKVGLENQALLYYQGCIKTRLLQMWSSQTHTSFKQALSIFYRDLISDCEKQLVFMDRYLSLGDVKTRGVVAELTSNVLTALDPSLQDIFERWLADQVNTLDALLDIIGLQVQFAHSMERLLNLDKLATATPEISKLAGTLYTFLRSTVNRYGHHQEKAIEAQLEVVNVPEVPCELRDLQEVYPIIRKNADKLFSLLLHAESNCNQRTQGCCYPAYLEAAGKLLKDFVESCRKDLQCLIKISTQKDSSGHWDLVNEVLIRVNCVSAYKRSITRLCTKVDVTISRIPYLKGKHGVLSDLVSNLLTPSLRQRYKALQTSKPQVEWLHVMDKLDQDVQRMAVRVLTTKVAEHVRAMPGALRSAEHTPTFASVPLEYVTQIGQYLMTLPQYIDISSQHQSKQGFVNAASDDEPANANDLESTGMAVGFMLELACREVSNMFINEVMQLTFLSDSTCHQLSIDLGYLCDVLDDLSLAEVCFPLQDVKELLTCKSEDFANTAKGKPVQIAYTIKNARKIT